MTTEIDLSTPTSMLVFLCHNCLADVDFFTSDFDFINELTHKACKVRHLLPAQDLQSSSASLLAVRKVTSGGYSSTLRFKYHPPSSAHHHHLITSTPTQKTQPYLGSSAAFQVCLCDATPRLVTNGSLVLTPVVST